MQHTLNTAQLALRQHIDAVAIRATFQAQHLLRQMAQRIQLRSRRGEGNAIWTILIIGLIAAVAATVLFPVGQKIIQMGQDAAGKLQSPPW